MSTILIDLRPILEGCIAGEAAQFTLRNLDIFRSTNNSHHFIFLTGNKQSSIKIPEGIKSRLLAKTTIPGKAGWKIWYDWQVPRLVKQLGASNFISTGGIASRARFVQWVWMPAIQNATAGTQYKTYAAFYSSRLLSTLENASAILVFSESIRQKLVDMEQSASEKILVIHAIADADCRAITWAEKENAKVSYAGGKEYFWLQEELLYRRCFPF